MICDVPHTWKKVGILATGSVKGPKTTQSGIKRRKIARTNQSIDLYLLLLITIPKSISFIYCSLYLLTYVLPFSDNEIESIFPEEETSNETGENSNKKLSQEYRLAQHVNTKKLLYLDFKVLPSNTRVE